MIAAAGATLALGVAKAVVTLLAADLPVSQGRVVEFRPELDMWTLMILAGSLVAALLMFGAWPAVLTIRRERRLQLQHEAGKGQLGRRPTFDWLIRWQAAIAAVFCLAAWACIQVVAEGARHDGGMVIEELAVMNLLAGNTAGQPVRFDADRIGQTRQCDSTSTGCVRQRADARAAFRHQRPHGGGFCSRTGVTCETTRARDSGVSDGTFSSRQPRLPSCTGGRLMTVTESENQQWPLSAPPWPRNSWETAIQLVETSRLRSRAHELSNA